MKNKYILVSIALFIAAIGTYGILKISTDSNSQEENVEQVIIKDQELSEAKASNDEITSEEIEKEQVSNSSSSQDELEDYKVLVGLIETYVSEVKANKNPDAVDLLRQVEAKKLEYVDLLGSIHNKESKEMAAKILKLNELRDELLELIDQLTMLKE